MDAVISNLISFIIGVLAGLGCAWSIAWTTRHAPHVSPTTEEETSPMTTPSKSRSARLLRAGALVVASVLLFGLGVYTGFQVLRSEYGCVNDYANDLADSLDPRQSATETLQDRQEDVFLTTGQLLADPGPDARRDLEDALRAYEVAQARLDAERARNPYPAAPREVCE